MSTFRNPAVLQGKAIPLQAGEAVVNRDVFDFANTSYRPSAVVSGDLIQIGVVPAGCKLVPHLSQIQIPAIDTSGTPTGQASIGTTNDTDALKAAGAVNAAQRLFGEDLLPADAGAQYVDVPIFLAFTANVATLAATGKIVADLAIRAFDDRVDTDIT